MKSKVVALIPARSGSKGIPNKNIKTIGGKPLIAHSIEFALKIKKIDRVIVSTDSKKIAQVAKKYGAEVPFIRPKSLASDSARMYDTVNHLIQFLNQRKDYFDFIALLQPTSPFRLKKNFNDALKKIEENSDIDSVVSLDEVPKHFSPDFLMKIEDEKVYSYTNKGKKVFRRQDVEPAYIRNGQFYISRISSLTEKNTIYGKNSSPFITLHKAINLDTLDDWKAAKELMKK